MTIPRPAAASQLDRLKETARRHELREEWRQAVEVYQLAVESLADQGEPIDPALHNRIGDLELKAGDTHAAIASYEHAVEAYAEQGYLNNAIALCGKMLRVDPSRTQVFLQLAGLQVRKNVLAEVRRNLASYIEAMGSSFHQPGLRAGLLAFAEEHWDAGEVRASLLDLLRDAPRTDHSRETLDHLLRELTAPGAQEPDGEVVDPVLGSVDGPSLDGLVFLDTSVNFVVIPHEEAAPGEPVAGEPETRREADDDAPVIGFTPTLHALTDDSGTPPQVVPLVTEPEVEFLDPGPADDPPCLMRIVPADAPFDGLRLEAEPQSPPAPRGIAECQAQVEEAYRAGDRVQLVGAYLALAEALARSGAMERAQLVYHRILEHDPGNPVARTALTPPPPAGPLAQEGFVDLAALILDPEPVPNPRMRVEQPEPAEDENIDFREALEQFKQGIALHVEATDFQSHYDLGVAFKEMGLLDEAIAQFQKAMRAPGGRLRGAEALGIAFFEQGRLAVAESVLGRAIDAAPGGDDEKIGLIYWLGRALEAQGKTLQATRTYERALAEDITFLDLRDRLARLSSEQRP